jgi:hypothetical protein
MTNEPTRKTLPSNTTYCSGAHSISPCNHLIRYGRYILLGMVNIDLLLLLLHVKAHLVHEVALLYVGATATDGRGA